jgi:hypothetical protein
MSEELRPIDGNGHVPGPYGKAPPDLGAEFEKLARCPECALITLHAWDCRTGQVIKDVTALLEAADVIDRRWPGWNRGTPIAAVMRLRAERLSRSIA